MVRIDCTPTNADRTKTSKNPSKYRRSRDVYTLSPSPPTVPGVDVDVDVVDDVDVVVVVVVVRTMANAGD